MSLTTIIIIGAVALFFGVGIGYYLRLMIALGKKRSIEIDIKQMLVGAKEEAQKITDDAKTKAEDRLTKVAESEKSREQEFKETERRLIKKDELLDARQTEVNKEVENIKIKAEEVKKYGIIDEIVTKSKAPVVK